MTSRTKHIRQFERPFLSFDHRSKDLQKQYRASAVMVYYRDPKYKRTFVLLGLEARDRGRTDTLYLHPIGGRIDEVDEEKHWRTAEREFREETKTEVRLEAPQSRDPFLWVPQGKYVLHLHQASSANEKLLVADSEFRKLYNPNAGEELSGLAWVDVRSLLAFAQDRREKLWRRSTGKVPELIAVPERPSPFLDTILQEPLMIGFLTALSV